MRLLLTPYLQRDLGVVILRPGRELLHYFSSQRRLLIANEPEELKPLPSGLLPVADQGLANDPRLLPFFLHERVIGAAGGVAALREWLSRGTECQWPHGDGYHNHNMDILDYDGLPVRLCWHHEHLLREQTHPTLDALAKQNVADWLVYRALTHFRFKEDHQLSLPELCWWAVLNGVSDLLPDSVARSALRLPPAPDETGTRKESDIVWEKAPKAIINERVEKVKPALLVDVDPAPPAGFMLRPKLTRWECEKYTQWVKSQPCCCGCGLPADDPHHIIDHGLAVLAPSLTTFSPFL